MIPTPGEIVRPADQAQPLAKKEDVPELENEKPLSQVLELENEKPLSQVREIFLYYFSASFSIISLSVSFTPPSTDD